LRRFRQAVTVRRDAGARAILSATVTAALCRWTDGWQLYGFVQSSHISPGTRENSEVFAVTTVRFKLRACAAMSVSSGPMEFPWRSKNERIRPYSIVAAESKSTTAKGAKKLEMAAWFRVGTALLSAP